MSERGDVDATRLLSHASQGDGQAARRLLPLIYDQLRELAERSLRRERPDHTLQPTALVHEAFVRLIDQTRGEWQGRTHFYAVAASEIRRVLVDHARHHQAQRRGGGRERVLLTEAIAQIDEKPVDLLDLEDALRKLHDTDERQARVVELRFYGGLSIDETAAVLEVSPRTVDGDWQMARAWLRRELSGGDAL